MKSINNKIINEYRNDALSTPATGSHDFTETKHVRYPFGKYEIVVKLAGDDRFLGIVEVEVNKDFRSHAQRIASTKILDVEEYYKDE
jgi:hypothetical protein